MNKQFIWLVSILIIEKYLRVFHKKGHAFGFLIIKI